MQGGKNWFLPKQIYANRFYQDSHWPEIWSNHFCPSIGPNGGSVATDSGSVRQRNEFLYRQRTQSASRLKAFFPSLFLPLADSNFHQRDDNEAASLLNDDAQLMPVPYVCHMYRYCIYLLHSLPSLNYSTVVAQLLTCERVYLFHRRTHIFKILCIFRPPVKIS